MSITLRPDHTRAKFLKRTVAAQLHAFGCVLIAIGATLLLPMARASSQADWAACVAFLLSGFIVFFVSSFYHFSSDGFQASPKFHLFMENLDHFSIYLFIAGTYTPFLLNAVASPWRIILLTAVWALAFIGILYTWYKPRLPQILQRRIVYTALFVLMGWTLVFRLSEIVSTISSKQLSLLVAGGLAYSIGAVVYALRRPRLIPEFFGFHELWHFLVLVGASLHFLLIFSFYNKAS